MKRMILARMVGLGAMVAALSGSVASAHHSGAMFDNSKQVTLSGTVKEFQFTNPHAWLMVVVKDKSGKDETWAFEFAGGPSALIRAGIKKTSLVPGEQVTVLGNPLRDGRPGANLVRVTKADGKVLNPMLGFGNTPAPRPAG